MCVRVCVSVCVEGFGNHSVQPETFRKQISVGVGGVEDVI